MIATTEEQRLNLELLSNTNETLKDPLLELLILENPQFPRLHPIAQALVISSGLSPTARLDKKTLDRACKAIMLMADVGICEGDSDSDNDERLQTYYVRQHGKSSTRFQLDDAEGILDSLELELVLSFVMGGETVDGEAWKIGRRESVRLAVSTMSTAKRLDGVATSDKDWLQQLFMENTTATCTCPESIYLCGGIDITITEARLIDDGEVRFVEPGLPVAIASASYHQGNLNSLKVENQFSDPDTGEQKLFWPQLLPGIANIIADIIRNYYADAIEREEDHEEREWLRGLQKEAEEAARDPENSALVLDVSDMLNEFPSSKPCPINLAIEFGSKHKLPAKFDFDRDIGLQRFRTLIKLLVDALKSIEVVIR